MRVEDLKQPVYLFPFTMEAALMHHILKNHGVTTAGFLDNKESLHSESYDGVSFLSPKTAAEKDAGAVVIICGYRHYELLYDIKELGFVPVKIEELLREEDVNKAIPMIDKIKFEELAPKQRYRLDRMKVEIKNVMLPEDKLEIENSLVMNFVEFCITEKCTLKCRDCSAMMHYYQKPKHFSMDDVINNIELVMSKADYVRNVSVIGGEPFMHPQLPEIMLHLGRYRERIGAFSMATNATIVPKDDVLAAIKESGVYVRVSDYGNVSKNAAALEERLKQFQIPHQMTNPIWYIMNQLVYDSDEDYQRKYDECYNKTTCNVVVKGRLYHCGFLAHLDNLRAIKYDVRNYVDLMNPKTTKDDIRRYVESKEASPGCAYCSGHGRDLRQVPAAEQTKEPLPYKIFDNYPPDFR